MSLAIRSRRLLTLVLALVVALDLGYSAWVHYHIALDEDVGPIVVPSIWYQKVMDDPLGFGVILRHDTYSSPNRYFAHVTMAGFFRHVPLWLQAFVSPIDSVYLACALFKTLVQVGLLYLLAVYATGERKLRSANVLAMALIAPLFQLVGNKDQLGVIDDSITYCFFYALPLLVLLVFLLPFYLGAREGRPVRLSAGSFWLRIGLAVYLAFHGPIVFGAWSVLLPGVLLWLVLRVRRRSRMVRRRGITFWQRRTTVLWRWRSLRQLPSRVVDLGVLFTLLLVYSFFVGLGNAEEAGGNMPMWERYGILLDGIWWTLKVRWELPLLLLLLLLSRYLLGQLPVRPEQQRRIRMLGLLGLFGIVYVFLIPLGGYRTYRPSIIRYDIIMPFTLAMMAVYAAVASYLLEHLRGWQRTAYTSAVVLLSGWLFFIDQNEKAVERWAHEREGMERLASSSGDCVELEHDQVVMGWGPFSKCEQTELQKQLLYQWHVTTTPHTYRNKPE